MAEFFSMGGYGAYVWPSYGLAAAIMIALLVSSLRGLKATEARFERLKAETRPVRTGSNNEESPDGDEA
ncbi:MAG: heme exporter protein CcmD [Alphaproteobacteria bacterium]|nr:heme exporter protein CcmD [Alphaproteobacteria bacterium]MBF0249899.1 heme exporter protein CcmD [Alphaproteobacteria bacterium]